MPGTRETTKKRRGANGARGEDPLPSTVPILRRAGHRGFEIEKVLNFGRHAVFACGVALWLTYGLLLGAWPIVVANVITLALTIAILAMKLRYG